MRFLITTLGAAVLALAWASPSQATTFTADYSGSSVNLAADAFFSLTGSTLTVTLTNTSTHDVLNPADVLTGVFFNTTHALTTVSASLNGSTAYYAPIVNNVGEGWQYGSPGGLHGKTSGISAAGLGAFGGVPPNQWFYTPAQPPLDGVDYGILSAGDNTATVNGGLEKHGPLIKSSIQFVLAAASGFTLAELGNSVVFQYGTNLSEPSYSSGPPVLTPTPTPEPSTLAIAGLGALGLLGYGLRRRRSK